MRYCLIIALAFSFTTPTKAQSLTGIWRGTRTQIPGGCFPEYIQELHITYMNSKDNSFMGNAYTGDKERFTKVVFTGRYNPLTKRMVIIESAVLQYNVPDNCIPCIKTYDLTWSLTGDNEKLMGEWKGHEMGNSNLCQPGRVTLQRSTTSVWPVDIYQNDTLQNLQKNMKLQSREKELVRSFTVDTNKVKIELYDNAEIDDDTVTVFLNNTLLLYKKRLTDRALTLDIDVYPNTDYELMMYADNLGRIPPNTSLMIITAGKKRYELRITSSEQKSAVIQFRLEAKR